MSKNLKLSSYMAIDQYGKTYHIGQTKTPRKELLNIIGGNNATKMYCDDKEGNSYHVGYIINGLWLSLYEVNPFKNKIN